jgi:hypothetical protein
MGPEIISRIYVPYTIINTRFIPAVFEEKISLGSNANPRLGMKVFKGYLDARGGNLRLATKPLPYQSCMFKSR